MDNSKSPRHNTCHLEVLSPEAKGQTIVTLFNIPSSLGVEPPFKMASFTLARGAKTARDQHSVKEVWFIICGSGTLNYRDEAIPVTAGDAFYFESHEVHQLLNNGSGPIEVFSIWW